MNTVEFFIGFDRVSAGYFQWADFAEVGTADFSRICLLVSVASEARVHLIFVWLSQL